MKSFEPQASPFVLFEFFYRGFEGAESLGPVHDLSLEAFEFLSRRKVRGAENAGQ